MRLTEDEWQAIQSRRAPKAAPQPAIKRTRTVKPAEMPDGRLLKVELLMPIKTVSEANQWEHWRARNKRKQEQQALVEHYWLMLLGNLRVPLPCVVTLTRIGPKVLDSDNLAGSFKAVRDQIAKMIGVDDGSASIKFEYAQLPAGKRIYAVQMAIQPQG